MTYEFYPRKDGLFMIVLWHCALLQLAEAHRGSYPETSEQRLAELGLKPVDELHIPRHRVKGHGVTRIIQVHADPRGPGRVGDVAIHFVVPGRVA